MTEQSPELRRLIAGIEILDVRLLEGISRTKISEEIVPSEFVLKFGSRTLSPADKDGVFVVRVRLEARIVPKVEPRTESAHVPSPTESDAAIFYRNLYELKYRAPKGDPFSIETLREFATVNAVFNAWPYWRHFVQSATAQMGLPKFVVPVFRGVRTGQEASHELVDE